MDKIEKLEKRYVNLSILKIKHVYRFKTEYFYC